MLLKVHGDLFIFGNGIRITLKVPSIRIVLPTEGLNGKDRPQIFINISVCKSSNLIDSFLNFFI